MIQLLDDMIKEGEGNISMFPNRMNVISNLLKRYKPQYIIEIGFNLGHSCKFIIDTLQSLENYDGIKKFYVFDICEETNSNVMRSTGMVNDVGGGHSYVKYNFDVLKKHYNIDIQLIEGDSLKTVKPFLDTLDLDFDFVEIDGFHEGIVPKHDIDATMNRIKQGGVLYMDDYSNNYPAIVDAINSTNWNSFDIDRIGDIFWAVKK